MINSGHDARSFDKTAKADWLCSAGPFVVAAGVGILLCVYFAVIGFAAVSQDGLIALDSKINPNTSAAASLMRLPGIGLSRAEAIVAYRQNLIEKNSSGHVFQNCDDLQKVKGIGPKTAQNICQWLRFE